ncbi:6,7-dimethyl-8-ribityllumazine synthase [Bacteroidia bacterium]|nr:6,7-dimethyl-8-ribityllumazine synthase [Bacteroidia bacterium]
MSTTNLSNYNSGFGDMSQTRIGIVVSQWNSEITDALLNGALDTLKQEGVVANNIIVEYVPGSFELSYGAQRMFERHKINAVICLGCVIQGETRHFDFICSAVAHGITNVSLRYNKPVIFGVLTTNNIEQAKARSGGSLGNKGVEAAATALAMI